MHEHSPAATRSNIPNWGTRSAGYSALLVAGVNAVILTVERSWTLWMVVVVVLLLLASLRWVRAGVRIDARGFITHNVFGSRRLRWTEVLAFDKRGFSVRAQLVDGTWKPIQTYGAASGSGDNLIRALSTAKDKAAS